jgi:hypothetical protein
MKVGASRLLLALICSTLITACGGGGGATQGQLTTAASTSPGSTTAGTTNPGTAGGTTTGSGTTTNGNTGTGTAAPPDPQTGSGSAGTTPVIRNNTVPVSVQASQTGDFNRPFVSVTVCVPGTNECQTIDRVLLSTSSTGLVLSAGVLRPSMNLPQLKDQSGKAAGRCLLAGTADSAGKYDSVAWVGVRKADIKLADMVASSLSIELMNDQALPSIPDICRSGADTLTTDLGFNGMLGLRHLDADCGAGCSIQVSAIPRYYGCDAFACAGVTMPIESQVRNPVALFEQGYNNGFSLSLPASEGVSNSVLQGSLVFGIGTQSNNQLGNAKVYRFDNTSYLTAFYNGTQFRALPDTAYRSIRVHDSSIPQCSSTTVNPYFCPTTQQPLSISLLAANGSREMLDVPIVRPPSSTAYQVSSFGRYGAVDEPLILGVPFYFGRTVFTAIEGRSTSAGTGPFIAF